MDYRIDFFCCKFLGAIWDRMTTFRRFKRVLADYTRTFKKTEYLKLFFRKVVWWKLLVFPTLKKLLCKSFVFHFFENTKDLHSDFFMVGKFLPFWVSALHLFALFDKNFQFFIFGFFPEPKMSVGDAQSAIPGVLKWRSPKAPRVTN